MVKILIIHGIGNYRPSITPEDAAKLLQDSWLKDLIGAGSMAGEKKVGISVAYYAHVLRDSEAQGPVSDQRLSLEESQLFLSWAAAYGIPSDQAQGILTKPIRQIASWVANRGGASTEAVTSLILRFIREVNSYFTSEVNRSRVQALIESEIRSQKPDLILAHSLGSVIAYETLWSSGCPVEKLITVGSPLALKGGIFDRVIPNPVNGLGKRPIGVNEWLNVADCGDIVAVPRFLSESYAGIRIDHETNIGKFAFHGLKNYLRSPEVRKLIFPIRDE
ncbi:hypothetical protein OG552_09860 [Streptomyces sp. NBC_01476]|uniref:hypothetical protein n=1 Tax=Streptomyces sp. NBC_01476 TaxID=2903881 RepID=UPI002E3576F3|nr:hypothetical protein [Streptomyces sp. NBC_01476]